MNCIAVIPARGGSKSIPKKNIKILNDFPLIYYTIKVAQESSLFERIIVSTDSHEIAEVAKKYGVEVIKRPDELALDTSTTEEALIHVLDTLKRESAEPDSVCTLEPTSPMRTAETLKEAMRIFLDRKCDSLFSVTEERSSYWKYEGDAFTTLFPNQPRRRQDRRPIYKEAGVIYITKTESLRKAKKVITGDSCPFIVPDQEAVDINHPLDFFLAETIMKANS